MRVYWENLEKTAASVKSTHCCCRGLLTEVGIRFSSLSLQVAISAALNRLKQPDLANNLLIQIQCIYGRLDAEGNEIALDPHHDHCDFEVAN